MDRIDYGILQALQNDARTTNREIAARVGLAPSSCLERVRKLEATGVIRGYHADIDPEALGVGMLALIAIRVDQHGRSGVERISDLAATREEVIAIYHLAGAVDFLVHVAVRGTDHLRHLALDVFGAREDVRHVETSLIFDFVQNARIPAYAE
ncbi:MAG: Lrp/AsnC family transcriptional regulator [Planctomycetota bacterium]|jgi:DNA-binding Lrp family transcriptional regulator